MISIPVAKLRKIGVDIFKAQGARDEDAEFLVETLVEANLTGHDSHGVQYYPTYSERIQKGFIKVENEPIIIKETANTVHIDGNWAFGQKTAMKLTEIVVEKAGENMVAAAGAYNCNHIGRIGYYTEWAAKNDIITTFYVNVGHPSVSVFNGLGKTFGTNPYSVSVPTDGESPFLVDYATSVVAAGKVSVAKSKKAKIPDHWIRDRYGRITNNPFDLSEGGWLLPFGDYKGYGLQMVCEILGAVLTGSRTGFEGIQEPPSPNGIFMIGINPEAFLGLKEFKENTSKLLANVKKIPPEAGKRVLVPGEPEKESKSERLDKGIPIPEQTWSQILELCKKLNVDVK
jgi:LDH2 family malate/lactate/ureidoglycolate dehydrogenase